MVATSQPTSKYAENTALRVEWRNEYKHLPTLSNCPCTQQKRERTRKNHLTHILKAFVLVSTTSAIAGGAAKTQGRAPAESCRAVADAELAGQPLHALAYPAQRNCFPSIRIRGLLALSRADRGGAGRLSNPPAGGLALLRIASLQLPCGRPELEARPLRALLRGVQISGLAVLSRADFGVALAGSVILPRGN
jgi:hypothetical protein